MFYNPFQPEAKHYGYAFNRNCSNKSVAAFDRPSEIVIIYDSNLGTRNASDTGTSLRINPHPLGRDYSGSRDYSGTGYGFVDGHAKWFTPRVHPSFSLEGSMSSIYGTWLGPDNGGIRTALVFSRGGIIEQVGPWPGDSRKIAHTYGRCSDGEKLKYNLTRVWIEGKPMYTGGPEKHVMDYTLAGDVLTIGLKGKYKNVYHRSHTYTVHKPKGYLWV